MPRPANGRSLSVIECLPGRIAMLERTVATDLLIKHWSGRQIPVLPEEIARAEGIIVEHLPPTSLDLSGEYQVIDNVPRIRFNPNEPALRQRFTIAHELGHHAMKHGPRYRDTAKAMLASSHDPVEVSANRFAAELLMPVFAVNSLVVQRGITALDQLASSFSVSEQAMKYRLKNLGFIP